MIDKNSPNYPAYKRECEALTEELDKRYYEIRERQKREHYSHGQDNEEISDLHREINRRLKEIKKKYGFDKIPIEDAQDGMQ